MEKNALQGLQLEILKALLTLQTHPNTSKAAHQWRPKEAKAPGL